MCGNIELTDNDDLLNRVVVKIENDMLFFDNGEYIDIGEGTGSCCNHGSGTIDIIDGVKLPALITKVESSGGEGDEDYDRTDTLKITLYGEDAKMAEIDYSYYETGYYGSMTSLEILKTKGNL